MSASPAVPSSAFERHRAAVRARLQRSGARRAGPGSVSWQVNLEIVVVAGWGRAILLQLAHPSIGAGVHHHTSFRGSLGSGLRRLHATVDAMRRITFGDTEQMIAAAAGISAIHDRVRGTVIDRHDETYSAHDPELQRWVHATLLDSMPLIYGLLFRPLTSDERDRYCSEAAIMEPLLGMPDSWLPRRSEELDRYIDEMMTGGTLEVTATSRALARALLYPPYWRMAWPAFRAVQLLTIGTLPASLRSAYGFEWRDQDARAFTRWTSGLRFLLRLLPAWARQWPLPTCSWSPDQASAYRSVSPDRR